MHSAEDLFVEDINNDVEVINNDDGNEDNQENSGNEQDNENDGEDGEKKIVKPKRVVRNPQPKLNVETLKGPKGLMCLEGYFKNKKYKGRGHEEEDLRTIMKTYEYWCHRLFPKFPFDDCLAKIESLGTKKPMQTYLKRIRMDLISDDEKPIGSDNEEQQPRDDEEQEPPVVDAFDSDFNDLVSQNTPEPPTLTEEQLERIRINKEKADQLRQARSQRAKECSEVTLNPPENADRAVNTNTVAEIENEELLERIRTNKKRAELLRKERLQKTNSAKTHSLNSVSGESMAHENDDPSNNEDTEQIRVTINTAHNDVGIESNNTEVTINDVNHDLRAEGNSIEVTNSQVSESEIGDNDTREHENNDHQSENDAIPMDCD